MKKFTITIATTLLLTSGYATAAGTKVPPPLNSYGSGFHTFAGTKVPPPINAGTKVPPPSLHAGTKVPPPLRAGTKVPPPLRAGTKVPPPASNIVAQDSGAFSLSDIFSQYFSF